MDKPTGRAGADGSRSCPSLEDLALLERWNTLQSGFQRLTDRLLADVEDKAGLAPSSFQALCFLLRVPQRSAPMNQLAEALCFTTAGTTKVADRLSQAGLIERRPSPADRRVTLAALTERGLEVAGTAALTLADALRERVVAPLGADRFEALTDAVGALDPAPGVPSGRPPC